MMKSCRKFGVYKISPPPLERSEGGDSPPLEVQQLDMYISCMKTKRKSSMYMYV